MSPKTIDIIRTKLEKLVEYCGYLKNISKVNKKIFISDFLIFGSAERFLHLSIEVLLDVARLTLIESKLPRAENNHEAFELLHKRGIISKSLFERIKGIAGFRNILVHEYVKIDRSLVYDNLKNARKDFTDFSKAITKNLYKNKPRKSTKKKNK
jgi:uncharacterized protein YutE (UPF0331/DUF86 family)